MAVTDPNLVDGFTRHAVPLSPQVAYQGSRRHGRSLTAASEAVKGCTRAQTRQAKHDDPMQQASV